MVGREIAKFPTHFPPRNPTIARFVLSGEVKFKFLERTILRAFKNVIY